MIIYNQSYQEAIFFYIHIHLNRLLQYSAIDLYAVFSQATTTGRECVNKI